mmetsp:Transcript_1611/g.3208  ORF Transcript_1611/g.3208 Transcript_1611/m.3208 type:complete len:271 (-) Transcript_1611:245-1057(-)
MFEILAILAFGIALIGAVLLVAAVYTGALRRPQERDAAGSTLRVIASDGNEHELHVPSMPYLNAMCNQNERKRVELAKYLKSRGADSAVWVGMNARERHSLLVEQADEVQLAVSAYVDRVLFSDICPELSKLALESVASEADGLLHFARALAGSSWPAAARASSEHAVAVHNAIGEFLKKSCVSKQERAIRSGFVQAFRRSCLLAFAAAALAETGTEAKQRAAVRAKERRAFFQRLGRGAAAWALGAIAMRTLPHLLTSLFSGKSLFEEG